MEIEINLMLAQNPRELKLNPERYCHAIWQFLIASSLLDLLRGLAISRILRGHLSIRHKDVLIRVVNRQELIEQITSHPGDSSPVIAQILNSNANSMTHESSPYRSASSYTVIRFH
jgi:hypothetical protein